MSGHAADTIFALSSGAPPAAIAIVRVSGPRAGAACVTLCGTLPPPRMATLRRIGSADDPIDHGLVLHFPAGGSVTGETLVEFHVHGGRAVVARLLTELGGITGLRPAEPGEFSRRSLLNGRIDLVRAEGLADLLLAETEAERRAAFGTFGGALGDRIEGWRRRLLDLAAELEAVIDHDGEADVASASEAHVRDGTVALRRDIAVLLERPTSELLRDGPLVVIAGGPNVGKSSLLNALVGREVAIVTDIAGTTRDPIEVVIEIAGRRVRLTDTAGLRETTDPVEAIGIGRGRDRLASADMILWLDDQPPADRLDAPTLLIHPRADLPGRGGGVADRLSLSIRDGRGMDAVRQWIAARLDAADSDGNIVLTQRQNDAAGTIVAALDDALQHSDPLLMAERFREALHAMDRLTGRAGIGAVFDSLFARFCIGK